MTRPLAGVALALTLLSGVSGCSGDEPARRARTPLATEPATGSPTHEGTAATSVTDDLRVQALELARTAGETLLSYDYRTLDTDRGNAVELLTEEYAAEFGSTFDTVSTAATEAQATSRALVRDVGLVSITPMSAQVLVFVDQTTRTGALPKRVTRSAPVLDLERVGGAWLVDDLRLGTDVGADDPDPSRDAALRTAQEVAAAFGSLSWRTYDADVARLQALSTGAFLRSFTASSRELRSTIRQSRTVQAAESVTAGLVDYDGVTAVVLASSSGTMTNTATSGQPERRAYRLRITLEQQYGEWLASDVTMS